MNVTIISAFRDAVHYVERYFAQMDALQTALCARGDSLYLVLGYGDSSDGTGEALFDECANRFPALLLDVSHGGPKFSSVEHPQRFKQLAYVGNRLLAVIPPIADVVGIVESDLLWDAQTMLDLIDDLEHLPPPFAAVAPMIMDGATSFYDVYAHRRNGQRFAKQPPFHPDILPDSELLEMDSAGSVLFMDAALARQVRCTEDEVIVGLCKDIYAHGGNVWLDSQAAVQHVL